ncbi:MAG: dodecin family protein [Trueperaceae bacterium]|nr:dodecin family protein [Trueperaceae bacterium]
MAAMVKVIEVLAQSEKSWDDAARVALEEASRTLRGIQSIYVKDMQAIVKDNRIVQYRLNAKISFLLERDD